MMNIGYYDWRVTPMDIPDMPKPNLITGEGHGHHRGWLRERPKKGYHQHKHIKNRISKDSRRRNRK